jgi:predicted small lipoprotein YifL
MKGKVTFLLALWLAGCGNVGPPIPPESIGVAAKLKKEQLKKEQEKAAPGEPGREGQPPEAPVPPEEEALPEFRPIGTR